MFSYGVKLRARLWSWTYIQLELSAGGSWSAEGLAFMFLPLCLTSGSPVGECGSPGLVLAGRVHGPAPVHHGRPCAAPHGCRDGDFQSFTSSCPCLVSL